MEKRIIDEIMLEQYRQHLLEDEKSCATIRKYMRDVTQFADYLAGKASATGNNASPAGENAEPVSPAVSSQMQHAATNTTATPIDKAAVLQYKESLLDRYAVASANSMLAAINSFFKFAGWHDCCVKRFKIQKRVFCSEDKELTRKEYVRLVQTAKKKGDQRLSLIIETLCSTGIRVSELPYLTMEALQKGEMIVNCKGKQRVVFLVHKLRGKLLSYAREKGLSSGSIFVTKSGRPVDRHMIWRQMKGLCRLAKVSAEKVFPHNLRHLFARAFYEVEKDIAKLADILGHSSINTTRVYMVTSGAEHRRKLERMHLIL